MNTQTTPTSTATGGPVTSGRVAAGWAAAGYVALFVLAIFGNFMALGSVLQPGDASGTADALRDTGGTFRLGVVAFLGIFLADVVVAWALYALFRPVQRDVALVAAWFRLTYTVVLGVAIGFLYAALWLAEKPSGMPAEAADQSVLLALQVFDFTWVVGLAAFGVHLVLIARLVLLAAGPRWLGWALVVAGVAYVVDTVAHIVIADYEAYAETFLIIVAVPSVIGELSLGVWLFLIAIGRRAVPEPRVRTVSA